MTLDDSNRFLDRNVGRQLCPGLWAAIGPRHARQEAERRAAPFGGPEQRLQGQLDRQHGTLRESADGEERVAGADDVEQGQALLDGLWHARRGLAVEEAVETLRLQREEHLAEVERPPCEGRGGAEGERGLGEVEEHGEGGVHLFEDAAGERRQVVLVGAVAVEQQKAERGRLKRVGEVARLVVHHPHLQAPELRRLRAHAGGLEVVLGRGLGGGAEVVRGDDLVDKVVLLQQSGQRHIPARKNLLELADLFRF